VSGGRWWYATWLAARRELVQLLRAKSFWISTAVLILAVASAVIIPALFAAGPARPSRVGVVGSPAQVPSMVRTAREAGRVAGSRVDVTWIRSLRAARAELRSGSLTAVLVADREVLVRQQSLGGNGPGLAEVLARIGGLQRIFRQLAPGAARLIGTEGITLPVHGLIAPPRGLASRLTGLGIAILIYLLVASYGTRIAVGVGEEKTSRVVEVLLATMRPSQLLAGKVIGVGILALSQVTAMLAVFLTLGAAVGSPLVRGAQQSVVWDGALWLVVGYAFYACAFAAAGSLISRQADAYNTALPLQLPLLVAYVMSYTVLYSTGVSWFYWVLAFVPLTAPVAMPVLVAVGAAAPWQVALAAVLCVGSAVGVARLAAIIYQRAILRTGGRVRLRQVLRLPGPGNLAAGYRETGR
jgi:ABC-2 type transport system permease protein